MRSSSAWKSSKEFSLWLCLISPWYVFTGFLESGKTKFIQETLEDERFNTGERTLLLVFEEGEEEYDVSTYPHKEVYEQVLDYETSARSC